MHRVCISAALFLAVQGAALCQPEPLPAIGPITIVPVESPRNSHDAHTVFKARVARGNKETDFFGSLPGLVMNAYGVGDYQIVNVPDWVDESGNLQDYVVAFAKPLEPEPDLNQLQQVLQKVLAERFHLRFHREIREIPGYDLAVDEHGPKFELRPAGFTTDPGPAVTFSKRINAGLSVIDLVGLLARELHRPVLDKTGISGIFDFDESIVDAPEKALFAEVQEQLGLKLVPATETIEVLVIDHVERPSEK
jgi:uncharacterized protein (TIGR03435 family)